MAKRKQSSAATKGGKKIKVTKVEEEENEEAEADSLKRNIRQKITKMENSLDVVKDKEYIQVTTILSGFGEQDDIEEDLVMIQTDLTEANIKCPYSMQFFVHPMKKYVYLSSHSSVRKFTSNTATFYKFFFHYFLK